MTVTDNNNTTTTTTTTQKGPHSNTSWITNTTTLLPTSHKTTLLRSPHTHLRGLCITTDEPLCSLHILLSTCSYTNSYSHKDDGLPHTLEHAIFLGSELYPYKGILDKLANRSLADGTNAWTATDHTAYTLTTAGCEGALNLLPIYANHVLYPTLSNQSFVTEVHHITREGKDKGVVYCEMQGRENTDGSLVDRAILDLLYPKNCGYSSETGGKLKNLRNLSNEQVRRYHEENYTPDNVMFVLCGNVEATEFLEALDKVEESILSKGVENVKKIEGGRPWMNHTVHDMDLNAIGVMPPPCPSSSSSDSDSPITESENNIPLEIFFPTEEESRGTISIGWRGPTCHQRTTWTHLSLLWTYLTDSAASPLQKVFVECDDPICAGVHPAHEVFTKGYHQLWFTEVDAEQMEQVVPKLFDTLIEIAQNQEEKKFDLDRMKMVIRRQRRRLLERSERRPTATVIDSVVQNFLYAKREDYDQEMMDLKEDVDQIPLLEDALSIETSTWIELMNEYILSKPYALVIGRPSAELAANMAKEEKEREEQQAIDLGEEKLKELGEELDRAIEFNEREIPDGVLTSVPIPRLENVKSIPLLTIRGVGESMNVAENSGRGVSKEELDMVLDKLRDSAGNVQGAEGYHVDWNHIESAFLYVSVALSTKDLTAEQRLYLDLLDELAFKLPATLDDGTTLSKDEFVSQVQDDTVSYGAHCGLPSSGIQQMFSYSVQLENSGGSGFGQALKWIRRALYLTELSVENVKMAAQRLLSEIPPQIRDGYTVCNAVSAELNFDGDKSNRVATTALRQWPFLESLVERMNKGTDEAEKVVETLKEIKRELVQQKNMQVFVAGNLKDIPEPMQALVESLSHPSATTTSSDAAKGKLITDISNYFVRSSGTGRAAICSLSATESSFLALTAPGVGAYDPNHASLLVAIEYLTALEGDFWVKLRGAGLTYGSSIRNDTESKMLKFGLFKCTDVVSAFKAASQILVEYASGKSTIPDVELESAKSSLAYGIISGVSTKLSAATHAWSSNYVGKKVDYDQWILSQISKVTTDDAMHALVNYLIPLFDPQSNLSVTCPANKLDEISEYFTSRGWTSVQKVPEEKLCKTFVTKDNKEEETTSVPTELPTTTATGISMFMPGAFAAQFQCGCPKCDR